MEYVQTTERYIDEPESQLVLILVLMEYVQTGMLASLYWTVKCLNPCSNGIRSNAAGFEQIFAQDGLNPCSNGIRSNYNKVADKPAVDEVLILVLMEYVQTI